MAFARQSKEPIPINQGAEQREWACCPVCNARITPEFARDFGGCQSHVQWLPDWLPSWRGLSKA